MQTHKLIDGFREAVTDEIVTYDNDIEPEMVVITPKATGSNFTIPTSWAQSLLSAVDYGTVDGFYQHPNIPTSNQCGERVVLYFHMEDKRVAVNPTIWSIFLSQIQELHHAVPYVATVEGGLQNTFAIDSPDFTAPNGVWNCDIDSLRMVRFDGSTFKEGPRLFGDVYLERLLVWPPRGAPGVTDIPWEPYRDLDLRSIAYQGRLSERCEAIYASNFVYIDEDGYERVDAYPDGARPKTIRYAIGPLERFELDSGSIFPVWDCSELVECINPVVAKQVILPTRSGSISLPVGPDVRNSPDLIIYSNGIEDVLPGRNPVTYQQLPCNLVYGLKILGISLPPTVEQVINSTDIYRHQADTGNGLLVGIQAEPRWVSAFFNFSLGSALNNLYNNENEDLLFTPPDSVVYVNHYGRARVDPSYSSTNFARPYYWVKIQGDGSVVGMQVPKITSMRLRCVDGYLERTFSQGRTGPVNFFTPVGDEYSGDIVYKIPALPEVPRNSPSDPGIMVKDAYYYTAERTSGRSVDYESTQSAGPVQLVWSGITDDFARAYPKLALNFTVEWFTGDSEEAQEFRNLVSQDSWNALWQVIAGTGGTEEGYEVAISRHGFEIEPFDTRCLELVSNFQEGIFDYAEVDPTTIDNVLLDLDSSWTKVSGAYRRALNVRTPIAPRIRYYDQISLNEPSQELPFGGGDWKPNFTLIASYGAPQSVADQYVYALEDIDIPQFALSDEAGRVYETWTGLLSSLIYGDLPGFKVDHGVSPTTSIGGSLEPPTVGDAYQMPLGVLNWMREEVISAPENYQALLPVSVNAGGSGMRSFGAGLFRENIPYYPDADPLDGDPIFIQFSKVGRNWIWSDGNVPALRDALKPETTPI